MASSEEVRKLASLARLSIPDEKLTAFAEGFESILAYVGKLDELTLPEHAERTASPVRNVFRMDAEPHQKGIYTEKLVEQFPDREGDALKVKQIITHD